MSAGVSRFAKKDEFMSNLTESNDKDSSIKIRKGLKFKRPVRIRGKANSQQCINVKQKPPITKEFKEEISYLENQEPKGIFP